MLDVKFTTVQRQSDKKKKKVENVQLHFLWSYQSSHNGIEAVPNSVYFLVKLSFCITSFAFDYLFNYTSQIEMFRIAIAAKRQTLTSEHLPIEDTSKTPSHFVLF